MPVPYEGLVFLGNNGPIGWLLYEEAMRQALIPWIERQAKQRSAYPPSQAELTAKVVDAFISSFSIHQSNMPATAFLRKARRVLMAVVQGGEYTWANGSARPA